MRLLISWVRDFVDVTALPDEIADTLALRGFEVASVEHLDGGDGVIDFEVTANRPDCLSVAGLAREIATAYELPFAAPSPDPGVRVPLAPVSRGESEHLALSLEEPDLCPRYAAAVVEVTPTVSPAWMTRRLQAAAVRPISPFVDITNYVLLELGHPMHAFDLATLAGNELRIRRASAGETRDDARRRGADARRRHAGDCRRPAHAGDRRRHGAAPPRKSRAQRAPSRSKARKLKPSSIRRTSKRLALKTEASARFERGVDVNAPVTALQRAIALTQQHRCGTSHRTGR